MSSPAPAAAAAAARLATASSATASPASPSPAQAGVEVRLVCDVGSATAVADVLDRVWETSALIRSSTVMAIQHAGGYASVAWDGERPIGASVAFLGFDDAPGAAPGTLQLHSHITGVLQPGGGVGARLKAHQAAWCRARGVDVVTWTVDPLVARNAAFNLGKLGATAATYLVDHYGPMADAVNRGMPTDRLLVRWDVAVAVADGGRSVPAAPPADAVHLVERGADGRAVVRSANPPPGATVLAVALPDDVLALRRTDPAAARAWGAAVRGAMAPALADGWLATGATRDGHYLLTRGGGGAGAAREVTA